MNGTVAEKVETIKVFGNEYKLIEIEAPEFEIDYSPYEARVHYHFTSSQLADHWVHIRPKNATAFQIRYSERTPVRFYHAIEIPGAVR
jgi:hypothetical protein